MSFKLRLLLLVVCAGALMTIARMKPFHATSRSHRQENAADSVVRYAIDEFVAACSVRPKALIEQSKLISRLPLADLPNAAGQTSLPD
jgi:hypothetical protein